MRSEVRPVASAFFFSMLPSYQAGLGSEQANCERDPELRGTVEAIGAGDIVAGPVRLTGELVAVPRRARDDGGDDDG